MGSCCSHGKTRLNRGPVPNLRNSAGNAATNTNCANYDQARQRVSFGELPDTNKAAVRVSNEYQGAYANGTNGSNQATYTVQPSAMAMPTLQQSHTYASSPHVIQTASTQSTSLQQEQQLNSAPNNNAAAAAVITSPTYANGVMHHDDLSNENAIVSEVDANDTELRHERLFSLENARDHGIVPGMNKYANMQSFPHGNNNNNNANEDSMEMESIASTSEIEMQNAGFNDHNDHHKNDEHSDDEDTGSSDMPGALSATTSPGTSNINSSVNPPLEPTNRLGSINANRKAAAVAAAQNKPSRVFFHNDSSEEELEESSVYAASSMAFGTPIEVASFASDFSSFPTSAASSVSSSSFALKRSNSRFSNSSRKSNAARRTLVPSSRNSDLSTEIVNNAPTQKEQVDSHECHTVSSVHDDTLLNSSNAKEINGHADQSKPPVQSLTPLPSTAHPTSTNVNNVNKSSINVTVVRTNSSKPFKTSRPTTPLLSHSNVPYGSFDNHSSLYTPLPSSNYASSEAGFASCRSLSSFADENENELITPRPWPTLTQGVVHHTESEKQRQETAVPNQLLSNSNNVIRFSREPFRRLRTATSMSSQMHSFTGQRELPPLPLAPVVQPLSSTNAATVPLRRLTSNQTSGTPTSNKSSNYNRTMSSTQTINTPDSRLLQSALSAWDQSTLSSVTHSQFDRQGTLQSARSVDSSFSPHLVPAPLARELHYEQEPNELPQQEELETTPNKVNLLCKDINTTGRAIEPFHHVNVETITIATPHANDEELEEVEEQHPLQKEFTLSPDRHKQHRSSTTKPTIQKVSSNNNSNEVVVQMCTDSEEEEEEEEEDKCGQPLNRSGQKITPSLSPATSLHVTPVKHKNYSPEKTHPSSATPLRSAPRGNQRSETKQSKCDNDNSISGAGEVVEVSELSSPSLSQLTPKQATLSDDHETNSQLISCENDNGSEHGKQEEFATSTNVKSGKTNSATKFMNETSNADQNKKSGSRRENTKQMELESVRSSRTEEELLSNAEQQQQQQHTKPTNSVKASKAKEEINRDTDERSNDNYENDNQGVITYSLNRYRAPRKSNIVNKNANDNIKNNKNNNNENSNNNKHSVIHRDERPPWLGGRHLTTSSHFLNPDFTVQHHRPPQTSLPATHMFNQHTSFPSLTPIRMTRATFAATAASNTSNKTVSNINKGSKANPERLSTTIVTTNNVRRDLSKPKWAQNTRITNSIVSPNQNKSAKTSLSDKTTQAKIAKKCKQNTILQGVSKVAAENEIAGKTTENNNNVGSNKKNKNTCNKKSNENSFNKSKLSSTHMDNKKNAITENHRMSGLEYMLVESEVDSKVDKSYNNNNNDENTQSHKNIKETEKRASDKKTTMQRPFAHSTKTATGVADGKDKTTITITPCVKVTTYTVQPPFEAKAQNTSTQNTGAVIDEQNELIHNNLARSNMQHVILPVKNKRTNNKSNSSSNSSNSSFENSYDNNDSYNNINKTYFNQSESNNNNNNNSNSNALASSKEDAANSTKVEESSQIARLVYETNAFTSKN